MRECKFAVIGGGCSGMAAAIKLWKLGERDILLIERDKAVGGVLNQCIHTGFGLEYYGQDMTGRDFAGKMTEELRKTGVEVVTDTTVTGLSGCGEISLTNCAGYYTVKARAVILAAGCCERPIDGTEVYGTRPSGVFTAGQAQRMMNIGGRDIGRDFVVLGSGDVGMIVARQLKMQGRNVIAVLEREACCGGLERNRKSCLELHGIPLKTRCTVRRILGSRRIEGVETEQLDTGDREVLPCDGLIVSTGLIPERELMEEAMSGGVWPDWLFLSGNCDFVHDTADEAARDGEAAAVQASEYLKTGKRPPQGEKVRGVRGKLGPEERVCLGCPRACILRVRDGKIEGNACDNYDRSVTV